MVRSLLPENFLKSRGRSGKMLILDTDYLLFLTKLMIKDESKIRLKRLFEKFEARGMIFDRDTQTAIVDYFEKLNLLEKKVIVGMLFMSKHFYNYLAEQIVEFFIRTNVQPGDKYHIQFERDEQVELLVEQVKSLSTAEPFYMQTEEGIYQSKSLMGSNAKVLIASNTDEVTPDFLTTLRNKVGINEELFIDKAMLLIHNSNLDSLVQGMTSFDKEGMPFHINSIEENLQNMMENSLLTKPEKQILKFSMETNRAQQGIHEQVTLFDYEKILTVLNNERLENYDYKDFGLFQDSEFFNTPMTEKQIQARLTENHSLFSNVELAHQYGPIDISLERHFDEQGVKLLSDMEWQLTDFGKVKQSNQKKLEGKGLEYIESTKK